MQIAHDLPALHAAPTELGGIQRGMVALDMSLLTELAPRGYSHSPVWSLLITLDNEQILCRALNELSDHRTPRPQDDVLNDPIRDVLVQQQFHAGATNSFRSRSAANARQALMSS